MCNRYHSPEELRQIRIQNRRLSVRKPTPARYNIAPSDAAPVILRGCEPDHDEVTEMIWGFASPGGKPGGLLRNARSETVHERRSYRDAYHHRRCLIPATGFFEWEVVSQSTRVPWRFAMEDESVFMMAGIWQVQISPARQEGPAEEAHFVMLTTEPNAVAARIHDRMPAILAPTAWDTWLNPSATEEQLKAVLKPYDASSMKAHRVTTKMSNSRYKEADAIAPVEDRIPRQGELF